MGPVIVAVRPDRSHVRGLCGLTLKGHGRNETLKGQNSTIIIGGWKSVTTMLGDPDWVRSLIFYTFEGGTPLMGRDCHAWEAVGEAGAGTAGAGSLL